MKLYKIAAIPVIALAAGISLTACGSAKAPAAAPAVTHTVIAPAATPKPSATTDPPSATTAPAPARTVYVQAPAAPPPPAYFTNSAAVVDQFYQDITSQNYPAAWALGGDNIGGGDYASWAAGYATTASISLGTFSAFGSNQVQCSLSALQTDGSVKTYEGTYTVSGGAIVAASIVQTG